MLFHRRTKKAIKYVWGVFSVVIIVSMVLTYSGVVYLTGGQQATQEQISYEEALAQLTPEQRAELEAQLAELPSAEGAGPTEQTPGPDANQEEALRRQLEAQLAEGAEVGENLGAETPTVPALDFAIPQ